MVYFPFFSIRQRSGILCHYQVWAIKSLLHITTRSISQPDWTSLRTQTSAITWGKWEPGLRRNVFISLSCFPSSQNEPLHDGVMDFMLTVMSMALKFPQSRSIDIFWNRQSCFSVTLNPPPPSGWCHQLGQQSSEYIFNFLPRPQSIWGKRRKVLEV